MNSLVNLLNSIGLLLWKLLKLYRYLSVDFPRQMPRNIYTVNSFSNLSVQQLRKAADLKDEIADLENELSQLLGSAAEPIVTKTPKGRKKRGMSAAGRARVAAAQKARWVKVRAAKK